MDTKQIIEEVLDNDPSLKNETQKLEAIVDFLSLQNPEIKPSPEFREKLAHKLTTIAEFRQIQPKSKMNFLIALKPLFLWVLGIFVIMQMNNYLSLQDTHISEGLKIPTNEKQLLSGDEWETRAIIVSPQNTDTSWEEDVSYEEGVSVGIFDMFEGSQWGEKSINATLPETKKEEKTQASDVDVVQEVTPQQNTQEVSVENDEVNTTVPEESSINESQAWENSKNDVSENGASANTENWVKREDATWKDSTILEDSEIEVNTVQFAETEDYDDNFTDSSVLSNDMDMPEETLSKKGSYYSCSGTTLIIEDSIDQRKIIKSYCDSMWWEIVNDSNVEYYQCKLNVKKQVWIEYIERDLCE